MEKPETLLTIAGFDPTGGAGILRDIKTFSHFGFYGTAVITANTSQNISGVKTVVFQDESLIKEQILLINEDFKIKGIKLGLPHKSKKLNKWIMNFIKENEIKSVFDPVIKPTLGKTFVENMETILPLIESAYIITPNFKEYKILKPFLENYKNYVLIKGFPQDNLIKDILIKEGKIILEINHKKDSLEVRGTGCTLSSSLICKILSKPDIKKVVKESVGFLEIFRKQAIEIRKNSQRINLT